MSSSPREVSEDKDGGGIRCIIRTNPVRDAMTSYARGTTYHITCWCNVHQGMQCKQGRTQKKQESAKNEKNARTQKDQGI